MEPLSLDNEDLEEPITVEDSDFVKMINRILNNNIYCCGIYMNRTDEVKFEEGVGRWLPCYKDGGGVRQVGRRMSKVMKWGAWRKSVVHRIPQFPIWR